MLALIASIGLIAAGSSGITIEVAHGSERERTTKRALEQVLATYDLKRYTFTERVVIDEGAINHAFPVLTLNARFATSPDELLSSYVHEQIHWHLRNRLSQQQDAIAELRRSYPNAPVGSPQGAENAYSTYGHLVTCYLELLAAREFLGPVRAAAVIANKGHYTWIYATVLRDETKIAGLVGRHRLAIQAATSTGRYIVTAAPLDTGGPLPLCLAVEPGNPKGVWWWEPVESDCSRRSTGPGLFSPDNARVNAATTAGEITASFRLQLRTAIGSSGSTYRDVVVSFRNGELRADGTGATAKTTRRNDLDIPGRVQRFADSHRISPRRRGDTRKSFEARVPHSLHARRSSRSRAQAVRQASAHTRPTTSAATDQTSGVATAGSSGRTRTRTFAKASRMRSSVPPMGVALAAHLIAA